MMIVMNTRVDRAIDRFIHSHIICMRRAHLNSMPFSPQEQAVLLLLLLSRQRHDAGGDVAGVHRIVPRAPAGS